MPLALALFLSLILSCADSHAQTLHEPKATGMSHVTVTSPQEEEEADPEDTSKTSGADEEEKDPVAQPAEGSSDTPRLKAQDYFLPVNDMKGWRYTNDLLSHQTDRVDKALRELEADPSVIPPKTMLFAAEAFTARNQMEKAALYYYLAQLRGRFDLARFPLSKNAPYDYGAELNRLSLTIGQPISAWVLADQDRSAKVFDAVEDLERKTPYAYKPLFPIPSEKDRPKANTWPQLHRDVKKDYFGQIDAFRKALGQVQ